MDLSGWLLLTAAVYVVIFVCLTVYGRRRIAGRLVGFSLAGREMGPVTTALAMCAVYTSASTFMGMGGWAYAGGLAGVWPAMSQLWAMVIVLALFMTVMKRSGDRLGSMSLPDYLGDRYNSDLLRLVMAALTLLNVYYLAGQFVGGATLLKTYFGLPYVTGVCVMAVATLVYVLIGGAYTEVMTNAFNGFVMFVVAVLLFFGGLWLVGGFEGLVSRLASVDPALLQEPVNPRSVVPTWGAWMGLFVIHWTLFISPHIANKFWAVRSGGSLKPFIIVATLVLGAYVLVSWVGLFARAMIPEPVTPDAAVPTFVNRFLPVWAAALVGIGILAAIISTAAGLYIVIGTAVGNEFFRKTFVRRNWFGLAGLENAAVEARSILIARITMAAAALVAVAISWHPPQFLSSLMLIGLSTIGVGVVGPVGIGAWWRRATPSGAIASLVAGAGTQLLLWPILKFYTSPFAPGVIAAAVGALTMIVVSLATQPLSEEHLEKVLGSGRTVEA
ncbi:MAG: hypothetical protein QHH27_06700 [Clostridia bacterium]|jgi:SSS family transporter|nr:hypothetical protein [Clostridia bacterium]MDH7573223.1 hypothetical protein [Clostridia bacterium]